MKLLKVRLLKRILLSLVICTMVTSPIFAQTMPSENLHSGSTIQEEVEINDYITQIELGEKVILPAGGVLTPISKEEYLSRLARERNISFEKAYEMESEGSINVLSTYIESYVDYSKEFTYAKDSKFKALLESTIKIIRWQGGATQIKDVLTLSSRRDPGINGYSYRWIETAKFSDPQMGSGGFPTTKVTLSANGYFEITSSESINVGVSIFGFSGGLTHTGEYIYQSDTMILRSVFSLY